MKRIKAIIIDDEQGARQGLHALLAAYCPEVDVVAQCPNVPEGAIAINKNQPDLVFLDIEMPEYNGFELLDFFQAIPFCLVFVTAYNQYAVRAFEVSATDYLLKPVEVESLMGAVEKVRQKRKEAANLERLRLLRETYQSGEVKKMAIPQGDGLVFVEIQEVVWMEADRAYTHIYLVDGQRITVSKPLRVFEEMVADTPLLFRAHRSSVVNLNRVRKYARGEGLLTLENGMTVAVARERKQEFEDLLRRLKMTL